MLVEMEISLSKSLQIGDNPLKTKKMFMLELTLDSLLPVYCKGQVLKLKHNSSPKLTKLSKDTGLLLRRVSQNHKPNNSWQSLRTELKN